MNLEPASERAGDEPGRCYAGGDRRFGMHSSKGRLPAGWCLVSCAAPAGYQPSTMELCWDSGQGLAEHSRVRLQPGPAGVPATLIRLPQQVTGLRLEMPGAVEDVAPGAFVIREISKLGALLRILRPRLVAAAAHPGTAWRCTAQAVSWVRLGGMRGLAQGLWRAARQDAYERQRNATPDFPAAGERGAMPGSIASLADRPLISIIMRVRDTPEKMLRASIESVVGQLYPHWELCIAGAGPTSPHARRVIEEYVAGNPRIKLAIREEQRTDAAGDALTLATGEFISLLDSGDEIAPHALYEMVRTLNRDPALDMIYSDEDRIDEHGWRHAPFFKPDWSPETLESFLYTAHLAIYRSSLVERAGGFPRGCDAAQDYDFVLRFTEQTERIGHVAQVLYHGREPAAANATSRGGESAGVRALEGRLRRTGRTGTVSAGAYAGCFDIAFRLPAAPLVSIIIPTTGKTKSVRGRPVNLILNCVRTIRSRSTYRNIEIVIVADAEMAPPTRATLVTSGCRLITYTERVFNFSKKINLGAHAAAGDYYLMLNDDVEVISPDWIERLLAPAFKPGVGAVGAKLLYPNGTLQHAGVVHGNGLPDHVRKHFARDEPGYFFSTAAARNYLGVTGACLMTSASAFRNAGGLDEQFEVNYGDIDYCLKLREMGLRTVYTPHAELYHFESTSRVATVAAGEITRYLEKWGHITRHDPYYNEAFLNAAPPDFSARFVALQMAAA